jgi:hypothetical protein
MSLKRNRSGGGSAVFNTPKPKVNPGVVKLTSILQNTITVEPSDIYYDERGKQQMTRTFERTQGEQSLIKDPTGHGSSASRNGTTENRFKNDTSLQQSENHQTS